MEKYQLIVLSIAILATFISFITIFYTMTGKNTYYNTSLAVQPCPDYWTVNNNNYCVTLDSQHSTISGTISSLASINDKLAWAKTNNVSWEGINYGQ